MRVTDYGKEAWSVNREPMNKNRIEDEAKRYMLDRSGQIFCNSERAKITY